MADVELLSRIQFAVHIGFHYLYPPMTIGLSLYLVMMESAFLVTKNPIYEQMTRFWVKIFALIFALGVATGIVNVFGIGTNWAHFAYFVGDVFGALLGAEGVFAFTLESGFLGILLFGWDRVKPYVHFIATCMVAFGSHLSATWIVFANSWMQSPAGYQLVGKGLDERCMMTNFWQALFNPTALVRLWHVLGGCWLTGTFLVLSVSCYYILKRKHLEMARKGIKMALVFGMLLAIFQLYTADASGRAAAKYQPAKLAALEGIYETQAYAPLGIIGWSSPKKRKTYGLKIPGLLSFLVNRKVSEPVLGLDQIPEEDWPVVTPLFQTYHWMIYMWGWMFMMMVWGCVQYRRGKFEQSRLMLKLLVVSIAAPISANITGWLCAEMGRQPWVVYGLLRTKDGISRSIVASQVWGSLIMYITVFTLLFILFIYLLDRKIKHGPDEVKGREEEVDPYKDPYKNRNLKTNKT